ncbi:hypothetical protein ACN27G_35255 [Plantactinospora sp. WMMB334]|uniref:hypothetical protein n=1 Tax=Plantactinospora sp. WMMB334 TaxID=3404119 RepID=UPI003B93DC61
MSRGVSVGLLSGFTAEQWGMVSAAQARSVGVSRVDVARLIADGALEPVDGVARVYRLVGAPPNPDLDGIRAVWLQLGDARPGSSRLRAPDAVVAGRSATVVLELGDLLPSSFEFIVDRRRQLRRADVLLRVRAQLPRGDWAVVNGLPVATVARIVADLLSANEDGSAVARVCQDAVRRRLTDAAVLEAVVADHAARYGAASPAEFVADLLGEHAGEGEWT